MDEIIAWLITLLDLDTTADGKDARRCADFIGQMLARRGAAVRAFTTPGSRREGHHLLAEIPGEVPDAVLLHAHMDTADRGPRQMWLFPADRASRRRGCVCGRGALDCKGPLAVWMKLLTDAAEAGPHRRTLKLLVSDLEEQGGEEGLGLLLERHPGILSGLKLVIGEGGGFPFPFRGRTWYTFQTGEWDPGKGQPPVPKEGGEDRDRIARILSMGIEKGYYSADILAYASAAADLEGRKLDIRPLYEGMETFFETAPPSRAYACFGNLFEAALREEVPDARLLPCVTPGYSDNRWFRDAGVPVIGFFPLDIGNSLSGIHGANEYVSEASLALAYRTMSRVLSRLLSLTDSAGCPNCMIDKRK